MCVMLKGRGCGNIWMRLLFTLLKMLRDESCMIRKVILLILLSCSVLTRDVTSMFDTLNLLKIRRMLLVSSITRFHYINIQFCAKSITVFVTIRGVSNMLEHINCMKTFRDQLNEM